MSRAPSPSLVELRKLVQHCKKVCKEEGIDIGELEFELSTGQKVKISTRDAVRGKKDAYEKWLQEQGDAA